MTSPETTLTADEALGEIARRAGSTTPELGPTEEERPELIGRRELLVLGLRLMGVIVGVEAAIMLGLDRLTLPRAMEAFADPAALALLATPLVLWLVVVPLWRLAVAAQARSAARERELVDQARRRDLDARIGRALGMARQDSEASEIVAHVASVVLDGFPAELLLADSSEAHLRRLLAVGGRDGRGPGCSVVNPWDCAAVRTGETLVFASGLDIDACPRLRDRPEDQSAVCSPIPFLGRNRGVLHVAAVAGQPPDADAIVSVRSIAAHAGHAIGTLRAFASVTAAATTDGLTGLSTRRHLEDSIRSARRVGKYIAVLLADLDEFKNLNDRFGHETGDRALRGFAGVLRDICREGTLVGRWGGEEFLIALPGGTPEEASALAERIRTATESCSENPRLSVSIGVAAGDDDLESLVDAADRALYEAKRAGRNRVRISAAPAA